MTRAVVTTGPDFPTRVETSTGHTLDFDEPESLGGRASAPTATEGVSASLAACTAGTLRVYADRKGWDLAGLEVAVDTTYDGPNPVRFEVTVGLPDGLTADQCERLLRVAGRCPVHRLLAEATEVRVERG
jgi:putative redox protein